MPTKIYTQPTVEPVSLEEAKVHLRLGAEPTDEDTYIYGLITAARKHCENFLGRALCTQTLETYLDEFPSSDYIELPFPPLASVITLKYKDTADVLQTWDAANYIVDTVSEPGRVVLAYGISWPSTLAETQAVQIQYTAGYGNAATVPLNIKQAIMLKVADLYENRGDAERQFATANTLELAVEALLWADRIVPV